MRPGEFFLAGLLAVFTLVPETCLAGAAAEPRAVAPKVQTTQRCSTQYCGSQLKKIPTSIKTVRTTAKTSVTKTSYLKTRTIANPKKVVTKTTTVRSTSTIIISTVTIRRYIWTATATGTRWFTVWTTTSTTLGPGVKTTVTRTPATKTAPTLSGFTAVLNDPANPISFRDLKKREPEATPEPVPEPVPEPAQRYPKAVFCTKTLKTIITATVFKKSGTKTVTSPPKTTWKRVTSGDGTFTEITLKNAPTTTIISFYEGKTSPRATRTSTSIVTVYRTTVTTYAPTPTFYAGCGVRNQAPPPDKLMNSNGWNVWGTVDTSTNVIRFNMNGTVYDCCVACHTLPASRGVCLGSVWQFLGLTVDTPCSHSQDLECVDWENPDRASCYLMLETKPNTCQKAKIFTGSVFDPVVLAVSNGPRCGHWKYILPP